MNEQQSSLQSAIIIIIIIKFETIFNDLMHRDGRLNYSDLTPNSKWNIVEHDLRKKNHCKHVNINDIHLFSS